jgi:hypothetical protein
MNSEWRPITVLERVVKPSGNSAIITIPKKYEGCGAMVVIKREIPEIQRYRDEL